MRFVIIHCGLREFSTRVPLHQMLISLGEKVFDRLKV